LVVSATEATRVGAGVSAFAIGANRLTTEKKAISRAKLGF
jgi:hypothetical protein